MPARKVHIVKALGFDLEEISQRIEEARVKSGRSVKELCSAVELTPDRWYRKLNRSGNEFSIEEIGELAEALQAPPGWPVLPWDKAVQRAGGLPVTSPGAPGLASIPQPFNPKKLEHREALKRYCEWSAKEQEYEYGDPALAEAALGLLKEVERLSKSGKRKA